MYEIIFPEGHIEARIKYKNGEIKILRFGNHVLNTGKNFLAKCLLEEHRGSVHIANMLFGDGGTINGTPKEVSPSAQSLNGVTRLKKPVIAQIDPAFPSQAIFTISINEDEGNGFVMNEMGLELSDETLFSLSTFADLNKTELMEIEWSWTVAFM